MNNELFIIHYSKYYYSFAGINDEFVHREVRVTIYTFNRYPLPTHKISAPWDGVFDVPRPSKVGSRFEFYA